MRYVIIDLQEPDTWNIQLTSATNFISSKDVEEDHIMHSKSGNIKFTSYDDANEVVDELFELLRSIYQVNLEKSMRGSQFTFFSVQLIYYKC